MRYAQFFQLSTGYVRGTIPPVFDDAHKKPIEACGDRAVIAIDGRINMESAKQIARRTCKERGYIGYQIHEGRNFLDFRPVTPYIEI